MPDDRFCSRCGSSAYRVAGGTAGPAPPVDDGHESILLEGTTAPSSVDLQEQVRSGSSLPWVVAGGLVVGLLMWGLFRWPSSEPTAIDGPPIDGASGQGPDPAVPDARAPADPGGEERDQNWSTDLMLERRARIGDGDRPDESDDPGRSADGATGSLVGDGGPLLGEQTGLGLVIGPARHRGPVEFLDLDTGRRHELAGITGSPVAMVGSVLVIAQDGAVDVADLSQPEPKPRRIAGSPGRWTQVVGIDDGAIVVFEGGAGGVDALRAYSVDGTLVDELDVAASSIWCPTPAVSTSGWETSSSGARPACCRRWGTSWP